MKDTYTVILANEDGDHITLRRADNGTLSVEGTLAGPAALDILADVARDLEQAAA